MGPDSGKVEADIAESPEERRRGVMQTYLTKVSKQPTPFQFKNDADPDYLSRLVLKMKSRIDLAVGEFKATPSPEGLRLVSRYEGKTTNLDGKALTVQVGPLIGEGAEAEIHTCVLRGTDGTRPTDIPSFATVIKVVNKGEFEDDYAPGRDYRSGRMATILAMHADDKPPVLPRYVDSTTIDGRQAIVMEHVTEKPLLYWTEHSELDEKTAVKAILPLATVLEKEEELNRRTLMDLNMSDVRLGFAEDGKTTYPYVRIIDFGSSRIREGKESEDVQLGIKNIGYTILCSVAGAVDIELLRTYGKEKQTIVHDISLRPEFKKLTPGLKYVLLKSLGCTGTVYGSFGDFKRDLSAIHDIAAHSFGKTDNLERPDDEMAGRVLKLNLGESAGIPMKADKDIVETKIKEICSPPSPETPEERAKRLQNNRELIINSLVSGLKGGNGAGLGRQKGDIEQYLEDDPLNLDFSFLRTFALALDEVSNSGLEIDPEFKASYLSFCNSCVENGGLVPIEKLREKSQPLFVLRDVILDIIS